MSRSEPQSTRDEILSEIQDFVSETGMAESAIGRRAVGSPHLVARLKAGQGITIDTLDAVRSFMAQTRADRAASAPGERGAA